MAKVMWNFDCPFTTQTMQTYCRHASSVRLEIGCRSFVFVIPSLETFDAISIDVFTSSSLSILRGPPKPVILTHVNCGRRGLGVPWRGFVSSRHSDSTDFPPIRAMTPPFARIQAPRVRFRAIFRSEPCSKSRSVKNSIPRGELGTILNWIPPSAAAKCRQTPVEVESRDVETTTGVDHTSA